MKESAARFERLLERFPRGSRRVLLIVFLAIVLRGAFALRAAASNRSHLALVCTYVVEHLFTPCDLAGVSSSIVLNLPLSLAIVLVVHAAAKQVDVVWQNQRLTFSWRTEPTAFKAAHARPRVAATVAAPLASASSRSPLAAQARGRQLDWKQLVDAPEVAVEVEALLDLVVRDVRTLAPWAANLCTQRAKRGLSTDEYRSLFASSSPTCGGAR